jgi:hypothetical protein
MTIVSSLFFGARKQLTYHETTTKPMWTKAAAAGTKRRDETRLAVTCHFDPLLPRRRIITWAMAMFTRQSLITTMLSEGRQEMTKTTTVNLYSLRML